MGTEYEGSEGDHRITPEESHQDQAAHVHWLRGILVLASL